MKKLIIILLIGLLMTACSKSAKNNDDYQAYRGQSDSALLAQGERLIAQGKYKQAANTLEALDTLYPYGENSRQGNLDLIYAYYKNDDLASAVTSADRYIRLYPRGPNADYAYYMKGLIEFQLGLTFLQRKFEVDPTTRNLGHKESAFLAFSQIVHTYPDSPYAPDSIAHMLFIRNVIARKQVLIAEFYFERSAYVAAANRAAFVVAHFDDTPEVPDALAIMVKSYRKLGLHAQAEDSYRLLVSNYPNYPNIAKLRAA